MNNYNHYIALDWAQSNMAIARMTSEAEKISVIDVPSDIKELQLYLERLRGKKILTFEETTTSQWLYTELKSYADEIVVCDPYRNRLLSEGPKTDKIDAKKLVQLLRANLLKPVFHSGDEFIYLRKLVSGYEDIVQFGVRFKNQRSSLFRANGLDKKGKDLKEHSEQFVLEGIDRGIEAYEKEKNRYEREFNRIVGKNSIVKNLTSLPGIGKIGAVKVAAIVVDPKRFKDRGQFLSYCGLIRLEKISGGRSYGQRRPRYQGMLKGVFKTAALGAIQGEGKNNSMREYYDYLMREKKYPEHNARHAVARRIAVLTLGILKTGKKYQHRGRLQCSKTL